jgi:serine/threonine protein kinase
MIGKTLAHYRITDKIGEGGMGVVFRAHDSKLDREVAIKILPKEMSGDPERTARFAREARTLASLQHANVAAVYGYEEVEDIRFLVMELVEGEDLRERLERSATLSYPLRRLTDRDAHHPGDHEVDERGHEHHRDQVEKETRLSHLGKAYPAA